MEIYYTSINSIIGDIRIAFTDKEIIRLSLPNEDMKSFLKNLNKDYRTIIKMEVCPKIYEEEINKYLKGKLKEFNIPILLKGTQFQMEVWNEIRKIPYGQTRTYKEIAIAIKRDKAYRAVGQACNRNPIPLIIPCHRVIGSNGEMTGFGGGIDLKGRLLKMEQRIIK